MSLKHSVARAKRSILWLRDVIFAAREDKAARAYQRYLASLRSFYLEPTADYSLSELAQLWRLPESDVRAIYRDQLDNWRELHPTKSTASFRVAWDDAIGASAAFRLVRYHDIELALASRFEMARPRSWRTIPVLVRVPRFVADSLPQNGLNEPAVLARQIEDLLVELTQDQRCPR